MLALLLIVATQLPPLSWTCPMHPEIVVDARGVCPICRMALVPVRLDAVWSCPVHSVIASTKQGRCPVCGRELVRVTMAVSWTCADQPATLRAEPGRCPDGTQATVKYTPRPHGNHNPQHGGTFFMAADNWHHLEGTYPQPGIFRVYLYDDYSKPLAADQVRRVSGQVTVGRRDSPLAVASDGHFLEARIPAAGPRLELTANLKFSPDAAENRFDFAFDDFSTEQAPGSSPVPTTSDVPQPNGPTATAPIPDLLASLHLRAAQIQSAIDRRAYSEIWVPSLEAKDIALSIAAGFGGSAAQRFRVSSAVGQIVRAAWLLDNVGDQGNAQEIADARAKFEAGLAELDQAVGIKN